MIHSTKIPTNLTGKIVFSKRQFRTVFSKRFQLDQTDPLSFEPKFPDILVEWIAQLRAASRPLGSLGPALLIEPRTFSHSAEYADGFLAF